MKRSSFLCIVSFELTKQAACCNWCWGKPELSPTVSNEAPDMYVSPPTVVSNDFSEAQRPPVSANPPSTSLSTIFSTIATPHDAKIVFATYDGSDNWVLLEENEDPRSLIQQQRKVYGIHFFPKKSYSANDRCFTQYSITIDQPTGEYSVSPCVNEDFRLLSFLKSLKGFRVEITDENKNLPVYEQIDSKVFTGNYHHTLESAPKDQHNILVIDGCKVVYSQKAGENCIFLYRYSGDHIVQAVSLEDAKAGEEELKAYLGIKLLSEVPDADKILARKNDDKWEILENNEATEGLIRQNNGTMYLITTDTLNDTRFASRVYWNNGQAIYSDKEYVVPVSNEEFAMMQNPNQIFNLSAEDHKFSPVFTGIKKEAIFSGNGDTNIQDAPKGQFNTLVYAGFRVVCFQAPDTNYVTLWKCLNSTRSYITLLAPCESLEDAKNAENNLRIHFGLGVFDLTSLGQKYLAKKHTNTWEYLPTNQKTREIIKENSDKVYLVEECDGYAEVRHVYYDSLTDKYLVSQNWDDIDGDEFDNLQMARNLAPDKLIITDDNKDCDVYLCDKIIPNPAHTTLGQITDTGDAKYIARIDDYLVLFTKRPNEPYITLYVYDQAQTGEIVPARSLLGAKHSENELLRVSGFYMLGKYIRKSHQVTKLYINQANKIITKEKAEDIVESGQKAYYVELMKDVLSDGRTYEDYKYPICWEPMSQIWLVHFANKSAIFPDERRALEAQIDSARGISPAETVDLLGLEGE